MQLTKEKLKALLVVPGQIPEKDFLAAVKEAEKTKTLLEKFLVEKGLIEDDALGEIIAKDQGYSFVDLKKTRISDDLLKVIPEIVAKAQMALAFELTLDGTIHVATSNPKNYEFFNLLEKKTGYKVEPHYATPFGLEEALKRFKSGLDSKVKDLIDDLHKNPHSEKNIVDLVNAFLEYAHDNRASDIHIEPLEEKVSVRFRIDGLLHEVVEYPKELQDKIVFRIKIMSHLRTDEHAAAQDGRFDYREEEVVFDVRVSIAPVTSGENIVLRLLSERARRLFLKDLGLQDKDLEKVNHGVGKPYGMILSVGPTGSGKTTTLYAILQILNTSEVNIMTIEDPVEYDVERVQQIQVNPFKNLTFATGLRSIVRQDPDIIMVGEVRDNETAGIAVNAAMTGHLVLSTLHANDAATTFPRLLDMGIEPFLAASGLNVVIGQRLVRRICEHCKVSRLLTPDELKVLKSEPNLSSLLTKVSGEKDSSKIKIYSGTGLVKNNTCPVCDGIGYSGRIGIFEVLEINDEIRSLITTKATSEIINKKAKDLGMTSMTEDGLKKVLLGITTIGEIIRVTKS